MADEKNVRGDVVPRELEHLSAAGPDSPRMGPVEYAVFLAVAIATHALVGYTLGQYLFDRPWIGMVGGVAADVDFLFPAMLEWPFVHRGITHTLVVGLIATALVASRYRAGGMAFGTGYATHLLIDTTTPKGAPHFYPLIESSYYLDLGTTGHSPVPTLLIWTCCLGLLWSGTDRIPDS